MRLLTQRPELRWSHSEALRAQPIIRRRMGRATVNYAVNAYPAALELTGDDTPILLHHGRYAAGDRRLLGCPQGGGNPTSRNRNYHHGTQGAN